MKRILNLLIVSCFALNFSSCEENGIFFPPSEDNGLFEVTIDDAVFTTSASNFYIDDDILVITSINTTTDEIFTLRVENYSVGSFSFEGINNVATYIKNDPVSAGIWSTFGETSSRGNITFTDIDLSSNTISGSFSFIGENEVLGNSIAFANGKFTDIPRSSQPVSKDNFTAKVDGVVFEDISLFANEITIGSTDLISISANRSLSETIGINLNADITPGEYDFGSFITQSYPTGQYSVNGNTYEAEGKLTITSHDTTAKRISGTFNFDATDILTGTPIHSITDGDFNVSY